MRCCISDEPLNRVVRGTVRVMKDGNIRWSYVSLPVDNIPTVYVAYLRLAAVNTQTLRTMEVRYLCSVPLPRA
jgi:hypothetical protein